MSKCLLCNSNFKVKINYQELLNFEPLRVPKLCSFCIKNFEILSENQCKNCSKQLSEIQDICSDCKAWQRIYAGNLLKNTALYHYNESFHDLMVRYKRYGDYILHEVFKEMIFDLPKADYYIAIPSSPAHYQKRKFDTVKSIFENLVELTSVLKKTDGESAQGEKSRRQRLNSKQTFYARKNINLKGKVLLLDDIYTTGRTLYHARDALISEYPNLEIESFSIAR